MIYVIATIEVVEGRREAFLKEFHRIVPVVRQEQGCLEYGPAVDVPTAIAAQGPTREQTVTVIEKWHNLEALQAHLAAPHMAAYRERVRELVIAVALQILTPA
jgi:quinol monooxygenase YgiN